MQLTLRCPDVQVTGSSRTPVAVLLGRFRLPAVLVAAEGQAHVEAWVSGLAGRSRISVETGGGKARRTGLDLVIAGTGEMTLAEHAQARRRPDRPHRPRRQVGGLRGLRRRVPGSLEPVVRRLARVGPLRAAYRTPRRPLADRRPRQAGTNPRPRVRPTDSAICGRSSALL